MLRNLESGWEGAGAGEEFWCQGPARDWGAFLDVEEGELAGQDKGDFGLQRGPWRDEVPRDLPEAGEYAPL